MPHPEPTATTTQAIVTNPQTFDELVTKLSKQHSVNENLARSIMFCESRNKPEAIGRNYKWKNEGTAEEPVWTKYVWSKDIGYWQVNDYYHTKAAASMGLDLYKWQDNLEYGFQLLAKQGTQPWTASKKCWGPKVEVAMN